MARRTQWPCALVLSLWFAQLSASVVRASTTCTPGVTAQLRQFWSDLKLEVSWPAEAVMNNTIVNEDVWILLRTGSRFPRQTTIPAMNAAFPDWPFDRALQLVVPSANTSDGSCSGCRILVAAFEGTWSRRTFPADELAWVNASVAPVPTTVVVDDNVLGLPRNASIEWCARRSGCWSCEASGSFVFDPSFRWQEGAIALAGSHRHFCALQESRAVRCWGWNAHGQLGAGHAEDVGDDEDWRDEPAVGVEEAEAVAVGWAHSCALTRSGQVWCWGLNAHGQLGLRDVETRLAPSRAALEGHVVSIAAGGNHSCAVWANGSLACWGANAHGQLGLGDVVNRIGPALVPVGVVRQVSAGWGHTCAVVGSGGVMCWGRNDFGQLGLGHTDAIGDDEAVVGRGEVVALGFDVESVACGEAHSCAVLSNGTTHCWGANTHGQLGLGHNRTIGDDEGPSITSIGDIPLGLSLGSQHSCAVLESQWLKCWGSDVEGALGLGSGLTLGDDEGLDAVVPVESGGDVLSVATGSSSTCIALHWGSVACWGVGASGEVGRALVRRHPLNATEVAPTVSLGVAAIQGLLPNPFASIQGISSGMHHTCAVMSDGSIRCWGENQHGQLGLGHKNRVGDDELPSTAPKVSLGGPAFLVSSGGSFTCALMSDRSVRCWGYNGEGQLGLGHKRSIGDDELPSSEPSLVLGGLVTTLSAGLFHSCAVLDGGALRCWGVNFWGQLGLGHISSVGDDESPSAVNPVSIDGVATQVACGGFHSCVLLASRSVRCWGLNFGGQLGLGHTDTIGDDEWPSSTPVVSLGGLPIAVVCGSDHTCALMSDGSVRCWGYNEYGQLGLANSGTHIGDSELPDSVPPVSVGGVATQLSTGLDHTCVILVDQSVRCWGRNAYAQLGLGHFNSIGNGEHPSSVHAAVSEPTSFISCGGFHTCAVSPAGTVRCWGMQENGQLGLGKPSLTTGYPPILLGEASGRVHFGGKASTLSTGGLTSCVVTDDGRVRCWGGNEFGKLGLGHSKHIGDDELPSSEFPVSLNDTAVAVAVGNSHICAILTGGSLRCWGNNGLGQLGLGHVTTIGDDEFPSKAAVISLGGIAVSVACGDSFTCAVLADGTVRCWGYNHMGQLGLGHTATIGDNEVPSNIPPVPLNGSALSVTSGQVHSCVVMTGGSVQCWGGNSRGQLGLGHTNATGDDESLVGSSHTQLDGPVARVAAGNAHTCALMSSGAVRCWGSNEHGQIGSGTSFTIGDNELPTAVPPVSLGEAAQSIACGALHSCAVLVSGGVRCWGYFIGIGLGDINNLGNAQVPSSVPALRFDQPVLSVACGSAISCVHFLDGGVRCWGGNHGGSLGLGPGGPVRVLNATAKGLDFVTIDFAESAVSITSKEVINCVLTSLGSARCWGRNNVGQLGIGSSFIASLGDDESPASYSPISVGSPVAKISCGKEHVCALLTNQAVTCWGQNNAGQLGLGHKRIIGDDEWPMSTPTVSLGGAAILVAGGGSHSCAVLEGGALRCWGSNFNGQLGLGHVRAVGDDELPTTESVVSLGDAVFAVSCGEMHTCVVLWNGVVRCWGYNSRGQLGLGHTNVIGDTELPSSVPAVSLSGSAATISCGKDHSCVVMVGGSVRCWGANDYGKLGLGHTNVIGDNELPSSVPVVSLGGTTSSVACGEHHTCALMSDGSVRCWGANGFGQLGLGHTDSVGDNELPHTAPPVPLLAIASAVSCGSLHTCAVLSTGRVRCWGSNDVGQLGLGHNFIIGTSTLSEPVAEVADISRVVMGASFRAHASNSSFLSRSHALFTPPTRSTSFRPWSMSLRLRDANASVLFKPRSVLQNQFGVIDLSAGSTLRAVSPSLVNLRLDSSVAVLSSATTRDARLCASKSFLVNDVCSLADAPSWVFGDPDSEITALRSSDASPLLLPRGGSRVAIDFATPWHSVAPLPSILVGSFPCTDLAFPSLTVINCSVAAGRGANLTVSVSFPGHLLGALVAPTTLSFHKPRISSVLPAENLSPFGNSTIRIEGSNFGVSHPSDRLLVAGLPCDVLAWTDSVLLCRPRPSATIQSVVELELGGQRASFPVTFSQPQVVSISPSVVAPANDSSTMNFAIRGSSFGVEVGGLMSARVGGFACESVVLVSTSLIECLALPIPMEWRSTGVEVVFGVISASQESLLRTLPLPSLDGVASSSFPTSGGVEVRVRGQGLGLAASDLQFVLVDGVAITSGLIWVTEFEVRMPLPSGVGTDVEVQVGLARNLLSTPTRFSYDRPSITAVFPSSVLAGTTNATFTLCGANLGLVDAHFGRASVSGLACGRVSARNASCAVCHDVAGPFTWPSSRDASVEVGGQASLPAVGVFDVVVVPRVTAVSFESMSTRGGDELRVIGEGFGSSSSDVEAVRVGSSLASSVEWGSSFELRARSPAGVGRVEVVVVAGGRSSPAFGIAYDRPSISACEPGYVLAGPGRRNVTIRGQNFGSDPSVYRVARIGGVTCDSVHVTDDETLECVGIASGDSAWPEPDTVWVSVAGLESTLTRGVVQTPGQPVVTEIQPFEVSRGEEITVSGSNFGLTASDVVGVSVGGHACASFSWQNQGRLRCKLPVNHPMFDPANRPANSSDPANWLVVEVQMASGAASTVQDTVAEGSSARLAPVTWLTGKVPQAVARDVSGSREVGRFEVVLVKWIFNTAELDEGTSSRVTGFVVEGAASDSTVFRAQIPLASLDRNTTEDGREWFAGELSVSSRLPIVVRVAAQNVYGPGAWSEASEPVLENCAATHFLATHRDAEAWQCEVCPPEAVCGGLGSANITARSGFWRVPWSAFGFGFASCPRAAACVGWEGALETSSSSYSSSSSSSSYSVAVSGLELDPVAIERCAEGHKGVLCASCTPGFFRDPTGACQSCGSATWVGLRVAGLVILGMVLLGVLLLRAYKSAGEGSSGLVRTLKIVFNHFQTIAIISSIGFQWPPSVSNTFAVTNSASSFGVEGVSLECVMGDAGYDPLGRSLVSISTPLWLLLFAAVFWAAEVAIEWGAVAEGVQQRMSSRKLNLNPLSRAASRRHTLKGEVTKKASSLGRWLRRMKVSIPVLIFLVHTSVTKAAFQMVTCETVAPIDDPSNSQLRLSMDLNTRCDDSASLEWMLGFSLPVLMIFSVGVPLATMVAIQRSRARLQEPEVKRLFGFLFFGFREGFEGWEGVNVLRKVLLAGVTVVLGPSGAFNQVGAALLVIVSFGFAHARIWPYSDLSFNRLEMASLYALCITMVAGMFIEESGSDFVVSYLSPTAIFLANGVFLVLAAREFVANGQPPKPTTGVTPVPTQGAASLVATAAMARRRQSTAVVRGGVSRPSLRTATGGARFVDGEDGVLSMTNPIGVREGVDRAESSRHLTRR